MKLRQRATKYQPTNLPPIFTMTFAVVDDSKPIVLKNMQNSLNKPFSQFKLPDILAQNGHMQNFSNTALTNS